MTLALAGLSVKHLPTVLGRMSIPTGMNESDVWRARSEASASELIAHAGLVPHALRTCAEELLGRAHMYDPMIKWLPIMLTGPRLVVQRL